MHYKSSFNAPYSYLLHNTQYNNVNSIYSK